MGEDGDGMNGEDGLRSNGTGLFGLMLGRMNGEDGIGCDGRSLGGLMGRRMGW